MTDSAVSNQTGRHRRGDTKSPAGSGPSYSPVGRGVRAAAGRGLQTTDRDALKTHQATTRREPGI